MNEVRGGHGEKRQCVSRLTEWDENRSYFNVDHTKSSFNQEEPLVGSHINSNIPFLGLKTADSELETLTPLILSAYLRSKAVEVKNIKSIKTFSKLASCVYSWKNQRINPNHELH